MNNSNKQPWYGLDDLEKEVLSESTFINEDPNPKSSNNSQQNQDKLLNNPESSIDKDPDQPWAQDNKEISPLKETSIKKVHDFENGDPAIDNWSNPSGAEEDVN